MAPGDARPAGSPGSGPGAWEAALESAPPAGAARPPERLEPGAAAGRARSLSLAMTGAVRAIAQTRVTHHSEPAKIEADNG